MGFWFYNILVASVYRGAPMSVCTRILQFLRLQSISISLTETLPFRYADVVIVPQPEVWEM
jgi:hypothetical protein